MLCGGGERGLRGMWVGGPGPGSLGRRRTRLRSCGMSGCCIVHLRGEIGGSVCVWVGMVVSEHGWGTRLQRPYALAATWLRAPVAYGTVVAAIDSEPSRYATVVSYRYCLIVGACPAYALFACWPEQAFYGIASVVLVVSCESLWTHGDG